MLIHIFASGKNANGKRFRGINRKRLGLSGMIWPRVSHGISCGSPGQRSLGISQEARAILDYTKIVIADDITYPSDVSITSTNISLIILYGVQQVGELSYCFSIASYGYELVVERDFALVIVLSYGIWAKLFVPEATARRISHLKASTPLYKKTDIEAVLLLTPERQAS